LGGLGVTVVGYQDGDDIPQDFVAVCILALFFKYFRKRNEGEENPGVDGYIGKNGPVDYLHNVAVVLYDGFDTVNIVAGASSQVLEEQEELRRGHGKRQ